MNKLIRAVAIATAVAAAIAAPVSSFAQSNNGAATRAEVNGQLVQLERAGYNPSNKDVHYPNDLLSAENRAGLNGVSNSAGGVQDGSFQGGRAMGPVNANVARNDMFSHR